MHRSRRVLGLATALVGFFAAVPAANAVSAGVVVAEVYGGGGNSGATLTNDFVELGNAGAAAADVTGWSVQYLPAAPSAASVWQVTPLSGTVAAGGRYLIQEGEGAGGTIALPTPDATGTIAMSATAGTVAVVNTTTPTRLQDRCRLRRGHPHHRPGRVRDCRRPRDGAYIGNQQHHVRGPVDAHRYRQQRRRLHGRDAEPAEQRGCPTAAPAAGQDPRHPGKRASLLDGGHRGPGVGRGHRRSCLRLRPGFLDAGSGA